MPHIHNKNHKLNHRKNKTNSHKEKKKNILQRINRKSSKNIKFTFLVRRNFLILSLRKSQENMRQPNIQKMKTC